MSAHAVWLDWVFVFVRKAHGDARCEVRLASAGSSPKNADAGRMMSQSCRGCVEADEVGREGEISVGSTSYSKHDRTRAVVAWEETVER